MFIATVSDGAWPTKGTGKNYNSYAGFANMLGGYLSLVINSQIYHRLCRQCEVNERLGRPAKKHKCVKKN